MHLPDTPAPTHAVRREFRENSKKWANGVRGRNAANLSKFGKFRGQTGLNGFRRGKYPRHISNPWRGDFCPFRRFGFAVAGGRLTESGIGARREFPEYPDKGTERPAPHRATGKAFFRPPVRIQQTTALISFTGRLAGAQQAGDREQEQGS